MYGYLSITIMEKEKISYSKNFRIVFFYYLTLKFFSKLLSMYKETLTKKFNSVRQRSEL